MNKAIILTAGYGTRLRPITLSVHKALIPFANKPLLLHILNKLNSLGINDFLLNTHYKRDQIKCFLKKYEDVFNFKTNYEPTILGTGGALTNFSNKFRKDENFILHNCDIFHEFDLKKLVDFHCHNEAIATLGLVKFPPKNSVLLDETDRIRGFNSNYNEPKFRKLTYSGVCVLNAQIFDYMEKFERKFSLIRIFEKLINENKSILGYELTSGSWYDLGTPEYYWLAHKDFIHRHQDKCSISYLGKNISLGKKISLQGFICIGDNSNLSNNMQLENCIVLPNSTVPSMNKISNSILWKDRMLKIR